MELADVEDSKSSAGDSVPVRARPAAPTKKHLHFCVSAFFVRRWYWAENRFCVQMVKFDFLFSLFEWLTNFYVRRKRVRNLNVVKIPPFDLSLGK